MIVTPNRSKLHVSPEIWRALMLLPYSCFLDRQGLNHAYIGFDPFLIFESFGDQTVLRNAYGQIIQKMQGNPFDLLRDVLMTQGIVFSDVISNVRGANEPPFQAGLMGYLGYEAGGWLEKKLNHRIRNGDQIPDVFLCFYDRIIVYDQHRDGQYLIETPWGDRLMPRISCKERITWAQGMLQSLSKDDACTDVSYSDQNLDLLRWQANFTRDAYYAAIERALEYIAAGDVYQVNLSQRFTTSCQESPDRVYTRLRSLSPAPFGAWINGGDFAILSNSPERFLRIYPDETGKKRLIETQPIKGTRPRGKTHEQDDRLAQELWRNEKESAEHVMIVDLERNDLGRICRYGSVHVPDLKRIEPYPTLYHLVSTVCGELLPKVDPLTAISSCFPGGSITGAPKIRSMEIIAELEPCPRGVYTGSIGFIDISGQMDLNIAIRTAWWKENQLTVQVGGAIVADSCPEAEYEETLVKGRAFFRTIG